MRRAIPGRWIWSVLAILWLSLACAEEDPSKAGEERTSFDESTEEHADESAIAADERSSWRIVLGENDPIERKGFEGHLGKSDSLLGLHFFNAEGTNVHLVLDRGTAKIRDDGETTVRRALIAMGDLTCTVGGPDDGEESIVARLTGEGDGRVEGYFEGIAACSGAASARLPIEGDFSVPVATGTGD